MIFDEDVVSPSTGKVLFKKGDAATWVRLDYLAVDHNVRHVSCSGIRMERRGLWAWFREWQDEVNPL